MQLKCVLNAYDKVVEVSLEKLTNSTQCVLKLIANCNQPFKEERQLMRFKGNENTKTIMKIAKYCIEDGYFIFSCYINILFMKSKDDEKNDIIQPIQLIPQNKNIIEYEWEIGHEILNKIKYLSIGDWFYSPENFGVDDNFCVKYGMCYGRMFAIRLQCLSLPSESIIEVDIKIEMNSKTDNFYKIWNDKCDVTECTYFPSSKLPFSSLSALTIHITLTNIKIIDISGLDQDEVRQMILIFKDKSRSIIISTLKNHIEDTTAAAIELLSR